MNRPFLLSTFMALIFMVLGVVAVESCMRYSLERTRIIEESKRLKAQEGHKFRFGIIKEK